MPTQRIGGAPWDLQGAVCWTAGAQGPEQPGGEHSKSPDTERNRLVCEDPKTGTHTSYARGDGVIRSDQLD